MVDLKKETVGVTLLHATLKTPMGFFAKKIFTAEFPLKCCCLTAYSAWFSFLNIQFQVEIIDNEILNLTLDDHDEDENRETQVN